MIEEISVRLARPDDMSDVTRVRYEGYKRFFDGCLQTLDPLDHAANCAILIARIDGVPVGTLRILDRRFGGIEMDAFLDVDGILGEKATKPVMEASRLSVPRHPHSDLIKMHLFKGLYIYGLAHNVQYCLVSSRKAAFCIYHNLMFSHLGESGFHVPPSTMQESWVLCLDLLTAHLMYAEHRPELHDFFCNTDHEGISI